jgi:hypothetical protein
MRAPTGIYLYHWQAKYTDQCLDELYVVLHVGIHWHLLYFTLHQAKYADQCLMGACSMGDMDFLRNLVDGWGVDILKPKEGVSHHQFRFMYVCALCVPEMQMDCVENSVVFNVLVL